MLGGERVGGLCNAVPTLALLAALADGQAGSFRGSAAADQEFAEPSEASLQGGFNLAFQTDYDNVNRSSGDNFYDVSIEPSTSGPEARVSSGYLQVNFAEELNGLSDGEGDEVDA